MKQKNESGRRSDYPIEPLILHRWSSRAMSGEELTDDELFPLFEAARWAPSSFNEQPWRILYVKCNTSSWDKLFSLLVDFNKQWCKNASVLGLIFSRTTFEKSNEYSVTHAFDTGAAWQNLCLEGSGRGLVVHGLAGFDYKKAKLLIPSNCDPQAMFAIGKKAPTSTLPLPLQEKEKPSSRKKISEFIFEGSIS